MFRRRLIRTLFLLPILLCLAGWCWSYAHVDEIRYFSPGGDVWIATSARGMVRCKVAWRFNGGYGWDVRDTIVDRPERSLLWRHGGAFYGFEYTDQRPTFDAQRVALPYWFALLLSSALFLLIYRQTRPNPHPKTAFPIELDAPTKLT